MKAVSFLPAATSFIQELGLEEYLHGVTFECPIDRPRIVRSHLENKNYSSVEINKAVSEHMKENKNIYYVEMGGVELLAALFHPNQFNIPELLSTKVVRYDIEEEYI